MVKNHWNRVLIAVCLMFLVGCNTLVSRPTFVEKGVAIRGYDPVAYFTENRPVKGKAELSLRYKGDKWLFSSEQNKQLFSMAPYKYVPQYGGYCAFAITQKKLVKTDPYAFTVVGEKLYLNYSLAVRELWLKNSNSYIVEGDNQWYQH